MTAQAKKPTKRKTKWDYRTVRRPRKGSKAEAILTLTASTPAIPSQIAKSLKCSHQAVYDALARYHVKPNNLETFKKHRADIFAGIQQDAMSRLAVADHTIRDARDAKDESIMIRNLHECERLERGQSTQNISYADSNARVQELRKATESKLKILEELKAKVEARTTPQVTEGDKTGTLDV